MSLALGVVIGLASCALAHDVPRDGGPNDASPVGRVLLPCSTGATSGTSRDCGWAAAGAFACRPDAPVSVGCSSDCGLGSCSGDSMLRVCDTGPCLASQALGSNDDSSCGGGFGVCSFVEGIPCPRSGEIFVLTGPFSAGSPYTCSVMVR